MLGKMGAFNVTLRIEDVPAFIRAARDVGWSAVDSGERLTTEDGVDQEAVVVVRVAREAESPPAAASPASLQSGTAGGVARSETATRSSSGGAPTMEYPAST